MSTYQRYLRERKEVEIEEQDLEELKLPKNLPPAERAKRIAQSEKDKAAYKAAKSITTNAATSSVAPPDNDSSLGDVIPDQPPRQPVSPDAESTSGKTKTTLMQRLFPTGKPEVGNFPKGEPEQRPESPATTSADQTAVPTKPSGGSVQVSGNTITKILSSAGITDTSKVKNIITAFQEAAKDNNLKIKDGFLS